MAPDGLRSFASPLPVAFFLELGECRIFWGTRVRFKTLYIRIHGIVTSLEGKSTLPVPKTRGEAGERRQSGASDAMEERIYDEGRGRVDAAAADGVPDSTTHGAHAPPRPSRTRRPNDFFSTCIRRISKLKLVPKSCLVVKAGSTFGGKTMGESARGARGGGEREV